ncbi:MAG: hypothetical protein L6406_18670 [Desulfobacterales bacterium]|nr:hypothetical protein [Desulfobacterales bacterium]
MMLGRLIEMGKALLRPVKRIFDEDVLDRIESSSIQKMRFQAESTYSYPQGILGKILFNTQYHWYYSWVDYTVAAALRYRGYSPVMFLCDGLPYCEYKTVSVERPSCSRCYCLTKRHVDAFGLNNFKLSEMLDVHTREESRRVAYEESIELLVNLQYHGINIGKIAHRNFIHYFKGVYDIAGDKENIFRKCIHSALLISYATIAITEKIRPMKIITPNGKFIQSGISIEVAKKYELPYYTWDVFTQQTAATLAINEVSHNQKIDDVWSEIKSQELTDKQKKDLSTFFNLQSRSENTPYQYYDADVVDDSSEIRNRLGLRSPSRIVSLFPNVEWDSTAMGLNGPYKSMHDWIFAMIDFARNNAEFDLVVRAHPGELKVPYNLRTNTPICNVIREKINVLPSNIHLIDPTDDISSYALAAMSEVVMVYTSTLGIEFALKGIRPWVAANSYYAKKGFTQDVESHSQVEVLLRTASICKYLTEEEVGLAEKLAYAVKFRRSFSYPLFDRDGKFRLNEYRILFPGNNSVIDNICAFIENKRNYLDIGPLYG